VCVCGKRQNATQRNATQRNAPLVLAHAGVDADGGEVAVHQQLVQRVGPLNLSRVTWNDSIVIGVLVVCGGWLGAGGETRAIPSYLWIDIPDRHRKIATPLHTFCALDPPPPLPQHTDTPTPTETHRHPHTEQQQQQQPQQQHGNPNGGGPWRRK
jgi:hypothetical protein